MHTFHILKIINGWEVVGGVDDIRVVIVGNFLKLDALPQVNF